MGVLLSKYKPDEVRPFAPQLREWAQKHDRDFLTRLDEFLRGS